MYIIRSKLICNRLFITGYYKSLFYTRSVGFVFWFLRHLKLMSPSWKFLFKNFSYLKLRRRNFLFIRFNRLRMRFLRRARRRILKYLFFLNKSMYAFMLVKFFTVSFDKLVQHLELVFSEYLNSKVLFLPNIYFERFKSVFWKRRRIGKFVLSSKFSKTKYKYINKVFFFPYKIQRKRRNLFFFSKKQRHFRKNRKNFFLTFSSLYKNFFIFIFFFNSNKVLLLKIFSMISRIKRLYRSKRRNKRPSLSFFVRFFRRAYSFFFHKRFLLKKKNLRKLCLLLSRYKSLRNLSQYNRDRGFRLINLLTIRNLKEIKKFKRLFRFKGKGFSRRRRFFLRRYWEFTNRKYRRYRKYRRRTRFNN